MTILGSRDAAAASPVLASSLPKHIGRNGGPVARLSARLLANPPWYDQPLVDRALTALDIVARASAIRPGFLHAVAGLMRTHDGAKFSDLVKALRNAGPAHGLTKGAAEQEGRALVMALGVLQALKRRAQTALRPGHALPAGTPTDHLQARRIQRVKEVARALFRSAAHGTSCEVWLTDDPAAVGFTVSFGRVYPYGGRYKSYAAPSSSWTITVPQRWLSRVDRRELAVVDGLMTLDAQPLLSPVSGVEVYAATWAAQARGLDVRVERGVIARQGAVSYHGPDVARAVAGLTRKMSLTVRRSLSPDERAERRLRRLATFARRFGDEPVTLHDSEAVGNCSYGTRSWCCGVGIDPEAGATTLARVIEGYRERPQDEAWAVVLHVVNRCRLR